MTSAAEFRKQGRDALQNKWSLAIGICFIASLLGASFGIDGGFVLNKLTDIWAEHLDFFPYDINLIIYLGVKFLSILGLVLTLISLVVGGATVIGYARFNLNLVDGREAKFSQLFSEYTHLFRGFAMYFLQSLYILLWSLLLIIPGIIALLSYAMTPYIMAENPDIGANEAIHTSKEMMNGNKASLFFLYLSFIGWFILALLTLNIGFLWLGPYMEATVAAFYREVSKKYEESKGTDLKTSETKTDPFISI